MGNQRQIGREYEKSILKHVAFIYFPVIIGADTGRLT